MELITDLPGTADVGELGAVAADVLLGRARAWCGSGVALAAPPEVLPGGFGRAAFGCALSGAAPPWDASLVVRVGRTADLRRERAWHEFCRARGLGVPAVVDLVDADPGGGRPGIIVLHRGPSLSLMEGLGQNPATIPVLLRSMAELHAGLHRLPVDDVPVDAGRPPLAELDDLLDRVGAEHGFGAERAWLGAHLPRPGRTVVCHGDVQPSSVRLDPGAPESATLVDWSHARVGDAEYDVSLTLLMFWSAPYLADGIGQRKMLKTVRDMITDGYLSGYEAAAASGPLDASRLAYWGAFHALSWSARLAAADAAGGGPADPWDPVGLVRHVSSYRKDLARRFARLTRG